MSRNRFTSGDQMPKSAAVNRGRNLGRPAAWLIVSETMDTGALLPSARSGPRDRQGYGEPAFVQAGAGTTALVETTWKQVASPDGSVMVR